MRQTQPPINSILSAVKLIRPERERERFLHTLYNFIYIREREREREKWKKIRNVNGVSENAYLYNSILSAVKRIRPERERERDFYIYYTILNI